MLLIVFQLLALSSVTSAVVLDPVTMLFPMAGPDAPSIATRTHSKRCFMFNLLIRKVTQLRRQR
jgi:hypothetical protein